MRIIGCDLHARQQTLSMLDAETGEVEEHVLGHEGEEVQIPLLKYQKRSGVETRVAVASLTSLAPMKLRRFSDSKLTPNLAHHVAISTAFT